MLNIHHSPPGFTERDAVQIALDVFDLRVEARALPGEHDRNFVLVADDGRRFVLKIAHAGEQWETLDLQNKTLAYLAQQVPALAIPRVMATRAGQTIATIKGHGDTMHLVRLLSYLPGKALAQTKPHTPVLLRNLGKMLGTLDKALLDFTHPAAQRDLKWDIPRAGWIRGYLQHILPLERRALVERLLTRFEAQALPVLPTLRRSMIHNDANDYNVLVDYADPASLPLVHLLDFGDMLRTQTICELAIAAAYVMMNKADSLAAAASLVAGYHETLPLTETELSVLFDLICARLCVSVTNSAYQQQIEPDNSYLTISEQPAWRLLEQLAKLHPRFACYTFRHACGMTPAPVSNTLVEWLKTHAGEMGRIVEPDLQLENVPVFDLSVGSSELGNLLESSDTDTIAQKLFSRMQATHSPLGVGRYNEARILHTSIERHIEDNNGPQWHTIHLGLDLFIAAGSPVYAPLAGIVHSFNINDETGGGSTLVLQHSVAHGTLTFYTLYGNLSPGSLDSLRNGMPVKQGAQIARTGDYPANGNLPPHLHFQLITDMLDRQGNFPAFALPDERDIWLSLSPDPNLIAGIPMTHVPAASKSKEEIAQLRAQHIGPSLSIAYQQPLEIVRGSMQYLYSEDGRAYLDAVNNVSHVGHCHPRVVRAGQEQMAVLNTNTRYLHEKLVRYAERLCATLPEPLRVCYFVCSGSEANELALRLAQAHTGQRDMVVVDVAYHGNTSSLIDISPYKFNGPGGAGKPPHVQVVPMPDTYLGKFRQDDLQAGEHYARYVQEAIEHIQAQQRNVAAFICESMPGCGGQIVLPPHYLQEAYRYTRNAGGVCIADEVQTGFGRVGTHFWAFETQGVIPDIVTMGKPIGNGHPLAAVVTTPAIAASFANGMEYFNTFGGNPVSCAIGMAVLDVIEQEQLQANAQQTGSHLLHELRALMDRYPLIGDTRGLGLFLGIELIRDHAALTPAPEQAAYIANRMRDRGILLSTDGPFHNVLKIKPPLVFTRHNADELVSALDMVLDEDFAQP
ncbi:MAG: aminotransferase class III-fold pyridoxal phosphate-dependent enzyme [Ktedonobacteraceae bacterium]